MTKPDDNVTPIRPLEEEAALAWLRAQPGASTTFPAAELARRWGWQEHRVRRRLNAWQKSGVVRRRGRVVQAVGTAVIPAPNPTPDPTPNPAANPTPASGVGNLIQHPDLAKDVEVAPTVGFGRSTAVRRAAKNAADVTASEDDHVARLVRLDGHASHAALATDVQVSAPSRPSIAARSWSAIGRAAIGLSIIGTGAFIAYTSMRANAWFGHSLTPDPVAGEVYSHLSVAAEVIACLIPTATRFYWQDGDWWTALRGWLLLAVALVVVFFAAGGFAVTNLNAGIEVRAERETASMRDLRAQIAGLDRSIASECAKRGDRCRDLERQRADANAKLAAERDSIKSDADPQAQAFGISSARLHVVQAGAMVALCLFSGLFISFGAGLIWRAR
jgi:hypothetical protein